MFIGTYECRTKIMMKGPIVHPLCMGRFKERNEEI